MKTEKISDWSDADRALARLAYLHREIATATAWRDQEIATAKAEYLKRVSPWEDEIEALEQDLHRFALANQGDLDGRSKALTHGCLGFLLVRELAVRSIKRAVDWLVQAKAWRYMRVKHELNKEALREAEPEILRACGARLKTHDQFWYEIDNQRYTVEE